VRPRDLPRPRADGGRHSDDLNNIAGAGGRSAGALHEPLLEPLERRDSI